MLSDEPTGDVRAKLSYFRDNLVISVEVVSNAYRVIEGWWSEAGEPCLWLRFVNGGGGWLCVVFSVVVCGCGW